MGLKLRDEDLIITTIQESQVYKILARHKPTGVSGKASGRKAHEVKQLALDDLRLKIDRMRKDQWAPSPGYNRQTG